MSQDQAFHEALQRIGEVAAAARVSAYLVGGAVRDLLLRRGPIRDVDVALELPPAAVSDFARRLSRATGWELHAAHERFGTATLKDGGAVSVDLAATRRERYPEAGRLPVVSEGAPLLEDLGRRDFSVHAMARRIGAGGRLGRTVDPCGGRADAARRELRLLHDASLADDPTRALRAVRYAARLGFHLERRFARRLASSVEAGSWRAVSGDRLRRALTDILREPNVGRALRLLARHRLLDLVVDGWGSHRADPALVGLAASDEERWRAFLAPLPPPLRGDAARRLSFPRALARAVGASR